MARRTTEPPTLVWFRLDLRVDDNPALAAAARGPVVPVYVLDDETPGDWAPGGAARWWLHHSLAALGARLARLGAPLVLRRGRAAEVLPALAAEAGAARVHWNRCYEPFALDCDATLERALAARGVEVARFDGGLLFAPEEVATRTGDPYKVFTPFWKACRARGAPAAPARAPRRLTAGGRRISGARLEDWTLLPAGPNWAAGFEKLWRPGEAGARARLRGFLERGLADYATARDYPGRSATSRLSPHLHWGEIGPRRVWHAVEAARARGSRLDCGAEAFLRELGWREFCAHLLFHFPDLPSANVRAAFDAFPWRRGQRDLAAWRRGRTGYPIVDAGLRELWTTGWMHNRVRMIAASFLIKHLMVDWREGARWFWDTLVDADLANNSAGWQWVAGSGADAAPYFRIFNPVRQGERFDPDGAYVRRWLPELAGLPDAVLHRPWAASAAELAAAGVVLGESYPRPIVEHAAARERALAAYRTLANRGG